MGLLASLSTVTAPARLRADSTPSQTYERAFWAGESVPELWLSQLSTAGVVVTPELAMTLTAFYSGVTMITYDLSTLPCQLFALMSDGGKQRIAPFYGEGIDTSNGIRSLAYMLRWQTNARQTATEFWSSMIAQLLLRGRAYAEIVAGPTGFVEQLLPRHPDRVTVQPLPSGRVVYVLREASGGVRVLTMNEMFAISDLSLDGGLTATSRVAFGSNALGSALAAERAAGKFFKSGMTAATVATYKGEMEQEDEEALHAAITRYATGVDNSFGLMLIPDDVTVANLGIEPEKAQMMAAREFGLREVARLLRIPPHKLAITGTQTYASQVQSALEYVVSCLRPIAVMIEQAIMRDLILRKDVYVAEFNLEALLRGDPEAQANYLDKLIRARVIRPSEARVKLNMNPDKELDRLSEGDMRPGTPKTGATTTEGDDT